MVVENGILVRVTNDDIVNGKFEFPAGVTSIDDDAFWGCSSLKEIIIPSNVSIIGNSVFAWCDQLEKVVILGNVTSVGSDLFLLCESLKEISIEKIDDINFYFNVILHAKSLKNITIQGVKLSYDEFVDLFSTITTNPTLAVFAFKEKKFISQNPFITKFTPESEIENFYRNSKAWKDLVQEYTKKHNHLSESDLLIAIGTIYKLCIALGFFHEEKQNEVKTFLYNNIFEINPYDLQDLVGELPTARCGYNEEFAKFFMKNFHLPLDYEDENSYHVNVPFLCRWDSKRCKLVNLVATVYEEWEQVKQVYPYKTVMADRETESENNNLTEDDVLSVFAKKVYKNVLPGNEELAELCGPYFYSDSDFEERHQWYEES